MNANNVIHGNFVVRKSVWKSVFGRPLCLYRGKFRKVSAQQPNKKKSLQ